ncbi:MAG TPA: 5-formyltetrahydrofolate cyclo-ligase [Sphingobacterium sp.]|nr:5-formyltetrahydrofolate cyclo-ligase [Sphingobacterium sp.]
MTKDELRRIYRQKRIEFSEKECSVKNMAIVSHLKELDWSACRYLHVYRAIRRFNEPDLSDFISWIRIEQPQIDLVVSKSSLFDSGMKHYVWDEDTQFEVNKWGIPEPVDGYQVAEDLLDTILVPMLVADKNGNRVGYGKGFYDRFLAQCKPDVQTIGISYFEVLHIVIDTGYWDIPLKCIVTPERILHIDADQ